MGQGVVVRALESAKVEEYRAIRLAALRTAPEAFGSVLAVEAAKPIERHAEQLRSSSVFGAYEDERIVGMIGFRREQGSQDAHKGFLWGFYVEPGFRRRGVGAALVAAALQAARDVVEQVKLSVVETNAPAIALYEGFGFTRFGLEPRALKTAAGYEDEVLMVLFLD